MAAATLHRLFGLADLDGAPVPRDRLEAMAAALAPPLTGATSAERRARLLIDGSTGIGVLRPHGGAGAWPLPFRHAASGVLVAGDVRLDDRDGLRQALGLAAAGPDASDGALLAEAWLRWGERFPARLRGDFALALWDPRRRVLLLARDPLGCAPLFYAHSGATLRFASDLHGVLAGLGSAPDPDPDWIAALLTGDASDTATTAYSGVLRALPGQIYVFDATGLRQERYWTLRADAVTVPAGDAACEEAFRERLQQAVRLRLPDDGAAVGVELSGGLDSSAVAAVAAAALRERGDALRSYTHVLPDALLGKVWPHRDERDWAERLRRHAAIDHHALVAGEGRSLVDDLRNGVRLAAAPVLAGFSVLPDALYERARADGVRVLLSGFGGDEVVSSPAALVPERWLQDHDGPALWREFVGRGAAGANASRAALLRDWAARRLPGRLATAERRRHEVVQARARALVAQLPLQPGYVRDQRLHARAAAAGLAAAAAVATRDPRAVERLRLLQGDTAARLEAGNLAAAGRGIGYRYPLLDLPLIEFFHALPPEQKWRLGWGRYLFRRAIAGWVPEELRWRRDKDIAAIPTVLARYRGQEADLRALLAGARQRPALAFLDHDRLGPWLEATLDAAQAGQGEPGGLFVGRLKAVLGLLVHEELRAEGWRPAQPAATEVRDAD